MPFRVPTAAAALVLLSGLALGAGRGAGGADHEAALIQELTERRADVANATDKTGKKQRKAIDSALRKLQKAAEKGVLKKRISAAAAAAKKLPKVFPEDAELTAVIGQALAGFRQDVSFFRNRLEQIGLAAPEGSKTRKKSEKKVGKADVALAAFDAAPSADSKEQFKQLKKALGQTKEQEGADDQEATWVVSLLQPAQPDISPDLNGDGMGDSAFGNVLAALQGVGVDANSLLAQQVLDGEIILLLQMFNVDAFDLDTRATLGVVPGEDTDGDPSDNFSGSEGFDVPVGLGLGGRPLLQADTRLDAGAFSVCLETGIVLELFGVPVTSPIAAVTGTASEANATGVLGFAIPIATVEQIVAELDPPLPLDPGFIQSQADIDTDGDEVPDALSAGLAFDAVPASIN